jgi:hypothetical protein
MNKFRDALLFLVTATVVLTVGTYVFAFVNWSTFPPFCYKHLGPAAGSPQILWAPTCNSGYKVISAPPYVIQLPDCGHGGAACTVGYGCLNNLLLCGRANNAIWDPKTGACGCDGGLFTAVGRTVAKTVTPPPPAPVQNPVATTTNNTVTTPSRANCTNNVTGSGDLTHSQVNEVTDYYPIRGAGANEGMEGGDVTKWRGPDGSDQPKTLEMFREGKANYITLASDASRNGEQYVIPTITYSAYQTDSQGNFVKDENGKYIIVEHTLTNVPAYVHDTGSFFVGHPNKIDLATQVLPKGQGLSTTALDNAQPSRPDTVFKKATGVGTDNVACVN